MVRPLCNEVFSALRDLAAAGYLTGGSESRELLRDFFEGSGSAYRRHPGATSEAVYQSLFGFGKARHLRLERWRTCFRDVVRTRARIDDTNPGDTACGNHCSRIISRLTTRRRHFLMLVFRQKAISSDTLFHTEAASPYAFYEQLADVMAQIAEELAPSEPLLGSVILGIWKAWRTEAEVARQLVKSVDLVRELHLKGLSSLSAACANAAISEVLSYD
jgi:hypothetical protein